MDTALNPNNYPTYNVGDKVTIRQWDDMESEFGLNESGEIKVPKFFTEPMKQYCGQTLPIVYVRHHAPPTFDSYYLDGSSKIFSSPMFEQSCPTVVCASTLTFDDLLKGATSQLANPQA
jgi:hypothetical protein